MDIFESYGIRILVPYLKSYVETLPARENSFLYLCRKQTMEDLIPVKISEKDSKSDRDNVKQYLENFYRLAQERNPFTYFSKLKFVLEHKDDGEFWSKDLFLCLISDRCLYFYDRREFATTEQSCGLYGMVLYYRSSQNIEEQIKTGVEHVSSLHLEFLKENQSNLQKLQQAIALKEQCFSISDIVLKEMNHLGKLCKKTSVIKNASKNNIKREQLFIQIVDLIQTYISSVIWKTRKNMFRFLKTCFS